jgi:hypothetical protein
VVGFWAMFSLEVSIVTFVYLSIVVVLFWVVSILAFF